MAALLEVKDFEAAYGPTKVLFGIDFAVEVGGITTILGANGAGKTTTLRAVSGMIGTSGSVIFDGARIDGMATEEIVRHGPRAVDPPPQRSLSGIRLRKSLRAAGFDRLAAAQCEHAQAFVASLEVEAVVDRQRDERERVVCGDRNVDSHVVGLSRSGRGNQGRRDARFERRVPPHAGVSPVSSCTAPSSMRWCCTFAKPAFENVSHSSEAAGR